MGRSQAVQAKAAGCSPSVLMNPILLKPTGSTGSQVIHVGKPVLTLQARDYYRKFQLNREVARKSYSDLLCHYNPQTVILEGAGGAAEINLFDRDLVNLPFAHWCGASAVLSVDIEPGGAFASMVGTIELLPAKWRNLIEGIIINRFRGDISFLKSGIEMVENRLGIPILGVLPYLNDLHLEAEDSMRLETSVIQHHLHPLVDIAVIRLPSISNFTDFHGFASIPECRIRYINNAWEAGNPDVIMLPGSKSVRNDMQWLRERQIWQWLQQAPHRGIPLLGICGGMQMLGERVIDPDGIESSPGESKGLAFFPMTTILEKEKITRNVSLQNKTAPFFPVGHSLRGYEIHAGRTECETKQDLLLKDDDTGEGFLHPKLPIFGTYLHGLFESVDSASSMVHWLLRRKGIVNPAHHAQTNHDAADLLANCLEENLDANWLKKRFQS